MAPSPIDRALLARLLGEVSAFGATPRNGVTRLAASAEDGVARDWLARLFREAGMRVVVDRVGNMFGLLEFAGPGAPLVLSGSHLDSQPFGGRYDGAYGVVAALVAALALRDKVGRGPRRPVRNLGVVNWTNEEGARFAPSTMGSNVFAGKLSADAALQARDKKGVTLAAALAAIGYAGGDAPPANVAAYVEAHIEQGPELERCGKTIGVVEGNWGTAKYEITFVGRAAHTGPTPMPERRDALLPAARMILFVRELSDRTGGTLLSSVGRLDVAPNSTNVVPERVTVFAEMRDAEGDRLADACRQLEGKARALAGDGIAVEIRRTVDRRAGSFDPDLARHIETVAGAQRLSSMRLRTVAGHDAVPLAAVLPSAMLFVPSAGGISHNEAEFTESGDLAAGTEVLAGVLEHLLFESPRQGMAPA